MNIIGSIFLLLGCIGLIIGQVLLLAAAYKQGLAWLLLCLFIPFASMIFLFLHFRRASRAFALITAGLLLLLLGGWLADVIA